jgi:5-methylthioadenosine/S-adenosylhomocysteine deaminase
MPDREPADLLIEPRWLLPIAPANTVLEGHGLVASGGRIVAVAPLAELRQRFAPRERLVRERHALLPGLVNAHTRACHWLLRGLPVLPPRLTWLRECVAPLERAALGADFVRDGTRAGIAEMLRAGITCYADVSPLPEESARTAAAAQVRALIALPVADVPGAWAEDCTAYLARGERLWDEYRDDPRIGLYFAPNVAAGISDATLSRVRRVADELDARIALHLAELPGSSDWVVPSDSSVRDQAAPGWQRPAGARIAHLQSLGLLRPGFCAVGSLECDVEAQALLARHGASLIACPQAELRLGAPAARLPLLPGGGSALGTDSPVLSGAFDLLAEARSAALLAQLRPAEALRLATHGGANALGLAGEIGSLEPGKAADLVCFDLESVAARSGADVAAAIVFGTTRSAVSDVWASGRAVVQAGRLLSFDAEELAMLPTVWAERLALEAAA